MGTDEQIIYSKKPIVFYPQLAKSRQLLQADLPDNFPASTMILFDMNGREVAKIQAEANQSGAWRLPALSPGLYVYDLRNTDNLHLHRGKLMIVQDL